MLRALEQPAYTLMTNHNGSIVCVRQEYTDEKVMQGWGVIARETELLPEDA